LIAIVPAGGKGTRMRAITGGGPKELTPVGGRPVIDYILDESAAAGVDETVVVSAEIKTTLNDHLASREGVRVVFQPEPTGLAPAVFLGGLKDDAVVLLPDALYHPEVPSARIARAVAEGFDVVLFTETVSDKETKSYGILEFAGGMPRILEKPSPDETSSRAAIGGRFGFSQRALTLMAVEMSENPSMDLPLTPLINAVLKAGLSFKHIEASPNERRFDCGSVSGYRLAVRELGS